MQGHRLLRALAVLILIVAVAYFVLALGAALMLGGRGFGSGWGTGWTGWLVLPLAGAAVMAALTLMVFGLMLFFLARIDDNLVTVRQQGRVPVPEEAAAPAPAPAEVPEPETVIAAAPAAAAPAAVVAGAAVVAHEAAEHEAEEPALETPVAEEPAALETPVAEELHLKPSSPRPPT